MKIYSSTKLHFLKNITTAAICVFAFTFVLSNDAAASVTYEALPDAKVYSDFVVGPGKIDLALNPGESAVVELSVANRLGADKTFSISEEDFAGTDDFSKTVVLLGDDKGPYSLRDYVSSASTSILIKHGYKVRIPVTVSVPADAAPGGLYGSVIVSTVSNPAANDNNGGTVSSNPLITRIGTLFFVRVKGNTEESGTMKSFELAKGKKVFFENSQIDFNIIFSNTGNVHLNPSGNILVTNLTGSTVGTIEVDPWFAMPKSLRFRQVEWQPPFLFGRYVAHASIERGYGEQIDEAEAVFWVLPWKIILGFFIGMIIIIWTIRWMKKNISIKRKSKEEV